MPAWYELLRAARYLAVPPWELARQPIHWREVALAAVRAEDQAAPDWDALLRGGNPWR